MPTEFILLRLATLICRVRSSASACVCFAFLSSLLIAFAVAEGRSEEVAPPSDPFLENVRSTEPLAPEEQLQRFHLPNGFRIELVAAEPDIQKPMNLAFDVRGRLWVSSSIEYPFAAPAGQGHDTVRILEDTQGDARADRITVFADGLNIPMGLYPLDNGCLVYSISNIERFRDTDHDQRADERTVIFGPLDQPVDTHGMQNAFRRGLDGWLYVNHGFANRTTLRGADGSSLSLHSGNIYRIRLDGSRVESFSFGQVNPFGSSWTEMGDLITADCHTKPLTLVQRGAYYQSFGKPHDGLGFAPELLHHLHGSTGLAGVAYLSDRTWPPEYDAGLLVGNVVTSRVHHDQLVFNGATPRAEERPDFLTCDDPWFRPVDLCLGPDGAIYIADFYNRIIGHYEVDIHHPGRDRHRGRIWKVTYVGQAGKAVHRAPDLSEASIEALITTLDSPHLPLRMLATDRLSDVIGPSAEDDIRAALRSNSPEFQPDAWRRRVHLRWILFRWSLLTDTDLSHAYAEHESVPRMHTMRMLAESPDLNDARRELLRQGLNDVNANVRRHAVDAMGQHVAPSQLGDLIAAWERTEVSDTYLRHGIRIALRNHLRNETVIRELSHPAWTSVQRKVLADICLAVPSSASANWIVDFLQSDDATSLPVESWEAYLQHAARYASAERHAALARLAQDRAGENLLLSVQLFQSILGSSTSKASDASLSPSLRTWGSELADRLVRSLTRAAEEWHTEGTASHPWGLETRTDSHGIPRPFLSSLPGGERSMSRLVSKHFTVPPQLSFELCGHRGDPSAVERIANDVSGTPSSIEPTDDTFVQLRLIADGKVVRRSFAPRSDRATCFTWNCETWAGQTAVLEVVDSLDHVAYAWLGISEIVPAVVSLPTFDPRNRASSERLAAELIGSLALQTHSAFLQQLMQTGADGAARVAAGQAWVRLHHTNDRLPLVDLLESESIAPALRAELATTLCDGDDRAIDSLHARFFQLLPESQQERLARHMTSYPRSAQRLLELLESGRASGRLLQRPAVREPLLASSIDQIRERIDAIVSGLPTEDERLQTRIQEAITAYESIAEKPDPEQGRAVFVKTCSACHQAKGQGQLVGPQLDGIGTRGLARVAEDVFAPYRNVDVSFRTTVLNLQDGRVLTGLVRDRTDQAWTLVDNMGKAQSIATSEIEVARQTSTSIMPDNMATTLSVAERNQLLAFLLSLREVAEAHR